MLLHCKLIYLLAMGHKRGREVATKINFARFQRRSKIKLRGKSVGKEAESDDKFRK